MASTTDLVMGLLLGVSTFLLVLSFISYRRSGVCSMRLLSEGLSVHVVFTLLLIIVAYSTDWLEGVDGPLVVVVDAVVLLAVIFLGYSGGRHGSRSS